MCKHFRLWKIDQTQLLPPSVQDFVDGDHLARFIVALVCEQLDLVEIISSYASSLGQPPFDPRLMVTLLLYTYCNGIYSSRGIAVALQVGGQICSRSARFLPHTVPWIVHDQLTVKRLRSSLPRHRGMLCHAKHLAQL